MDYVVTLLIALSLSMDAFSLALSIGTLRLPRKVIICLSLLVGIFHFFMPALGNLVGKSFISAVSVDIHLLSGVIFFYIAILMFKDVKNDNGENFRLSLIGALVFAFSVSLDSFGVGFTITTKQIFSFGSFSICSFLFTFLGLKLGGMLGNLIGKYSILLGAIIMSVLGIMNICKILY